MSKMVLKFPDGIYEVDQEIIFSIYRSNANAKAKTRSDVSYERLIEDPWDGPPVYSWGVDWDKLKRVVDQSTVWHASLRFIEKAEKIGMKPQKAELQRVLNETRNASVLFRNLSKEAARKTMQRIEKNVKFGEKGVAISKFIRDTSVTTLGVCFTILSGGSGAGLVYAAGGKSVLDGAVTLQDTGGDITAARFKVGTSFVINMIPGGKTAGGKVALWVVKSGAESAADGAQAFVEGKTVEEAYRAGLEKAVASALGGGLDLIANQKQVKEMLAKTVMPVALKIEYNRVPGLTMVKNPAEKFAEGMVNQPKGWVSKAIAGPAAKLILKPPPAVPRNPRGRFIQTGSLYGAHLLQAAIKGPLSNITGPVPTYTQYKNMISRRLNEEYWKPKYWQ